LTKPTKSARGRLSTPEEFGDIVLKSDSQGRVTRVRDVGHAEVGAADYGNTAFVDRDDASSLLIYAEPGANSLAVDREVLSTVRELAKDFPQGVAYTIVYDPSIFISKSVNEVIVTIFVAIALVVGVVFIFPQTWRATIIPVVAIPVSLLGTFIVLEILGISINNLSLFGLVVAVGIVVDDAIVVVENVERNLGSGISPAEAAHRTMDEVGGSTYLDRTDSMRCFRALRLSIGDFRTVLPPIRSNDRGIDGNLVLRFVDAEPRALRGAVQGALNLLRQGVGMKTIGVRSVIGCA
jgi:multidrug efflux pump subunit AcrB